MISRHDANSKNFIGTGAFSTVFGLPNHNPTPSTPRGEKRHANRNPGEKARAEAAWNRGRSINKSKKQIQLETNGAKNKAR